METLESKQKTKPKVASPWRAFFTPLIEYCQKPVWPKPPVQLSPGKHLTQKPSTQTRKVLQIFSKIQSEFNNRKHHVNSALADTTHSAYNSAISAHKLPAAHTEIHWGARRKNRAALFRGKCEIYHMPFIFCFPFSPCFRLTSAN